MDGPATPPPPSDVRVRTGSGSGGQPCCRSWPPNQKALGKELAPSYILSCDEGMLASILAAAVLMSHSREFARIQLVGKLWQHG